MRGVARAFAVLVASTVAAVSPTSAIGLRAGDPDSWTAIGPYDDEGVATLDVAAFGLGPAAGELYAGVPGGIAFSTDDGHSWAPARVNLPDGYRLSRIGWLGAHPVARRVYAIAALRDEEFGDDLPYLIASRDGGASWAWRSGIAGGVEVVTAIALAPSRPSVLYYALYGQHAGDWADLLKSTDGGQSWISIKNGPIADLPGGNESGVYAAIPIHSLVVHPIRADTLYVGLHKGVFKTADGGKTWHRTALRINGSVGALAIDPRRPRRVYALNCAGPWWVESAACALNVSRDAGRTWKRLRRGVDDLLVTPYSSNVWIVEDGEIHRSTDRGSTWQRETSLPDQGSLVGVDSEGRLYSAVKDRGLWRHQTLTPNVARNAWGGREFARGRARGQVLH